MSGKNKVGHFRHYYENHGSSPIAETPFDLLGKLRGVEWVHGLLLFPLVLEKM